MKSELRRKTFRKPLTRVQLAILSDRLKTSEDDAELTVEHISRNFAKILGITESSISTDFEFSGRELDMIFTINKQNTPVKK